MCYIAWELHCIEILEECTQEELQLQGWTCKVICEGKTLFCMDEWKTFCMGQIQKFKKTLNDLILTKKKYVVAGQGQKF